MFRWISRHIAKTKARRIEKVRRQIKALEIHAERKAAWLELVDANRRRDSRDIGHARQRLKAAQNAALGRVQ